MVVFFTKTSSFQDLVEAREKVGIQIKSEFDKEGIEFAFPTQTIHLTK
jgi:small-conductance mechanosensitive channel